MRPLRQLIKIFKRCWHFALAFEGAVINRHPSRRLFVLGVTGTKGKTLTIELINAVLTAGGKRTAVLSSVAEEICGERRENATGNTMPGRFYIQSFLRRAAERGAEVAVIEVTSEGVIQHRHRFIEWDAGLILNLHPEHIEAHGGFEKYRAAKVRFFDYVARASRKKTKYFFINSDDEHQAHFARAAERAKDGEIVFFEGGFMTANYNAARALGRAFGIPEETVERALREFPGLPGRMEVVQKEPFLVLVDYAHTHVSLEEVYRRVRGMGPKRMICVLGSAGGGRDKWKRPGLGALADRYCDEVILTDEDPFDENPVKILTEIRAGIRRSEGVREILDRREAIRKAISLAKEGDAVVLTGKGSERAIRVARGEKIPWNESEEARIALREIGAAGEE